MEIGTLVVVVLKARNLRDIHSFYKQDAYAQISLNGKKQDTRVEVKGGQHPVWDDELRVPVMKGEGEKERKLQVSCWAKEPRQDELLASGSIDISETLKTGEFDDWIPLTEPSGQQRGEIYLEMTFFSNAAPPIITVSQAKPVNKLVANVNGANIQRRPSKLSPGERLARPSALTPNRPGPSNLSAHRPPAEPRKDAPLPTLPSPKHSPGSLSPHRLSPPKTSAVPNTLKPGPASRPPAERRASDPASLLGPHDGQHRRISSSMSPPRSPNPYIDPPKHQSPPLPSIPLSRDAPFFPIAMPSAATPAPEAGYPSPLYGPLSPSTPSQPIYQQQTFNQLPQPGFYHQPSHTVSPQPPPQHSYTPSPLPLQHLHSHSPQPPLHSYTPTPQPPVHSYTPTPQPLPHSYTPSPQPQTYQQPYQAPYTAQPHQQYSGPPPPVPLALPHPYVPQVATSPPHAPQSYSEQPRVALVFSPGPQTTPPASASDGIPDPYLNARYQTPLPLPAKPPPPHPSSSGDAEREKQQRILQEAEKRREQEERDLELARMLDRELNLADAPASSGRREDRWRDSSAQLSDMPGSWAR